MDDNVIKEYLIKLGIDIPMSEIQKFNSHMEAFDKGVFGLVKKINNFFSGWKAAISVYAGAAKGVYGFAQSVAKADLETQKLAKRMFLTDESAKTLTRTLDAMGLQFDDLQDVALNPELLSQYHELIELGKSLGSGPEISKAMRDIREVGFEFTKIRMTISYIRERIAYYLSQIIQSPTGKAFVNSIKSVNKFLTVNFDRIASKIATFLSIVIKTITRITQLIQGWLYLIKRGYESLKYYMGDLAKVVVTVFAAVALTLMSGPFGRFLLLFQGIMLLVDDYLTYKEGSGRYVIPWGNIGEYVSAVGQVIDKIVEKFRELANIIGDIITFFAGPPSEQAFFHDILTKKIKDGWEPPRIIFDPDQYERYKIYEQKYEGPMRELQESLNREKPIVLSFNGSNFTREDIERGVRGNSQVEVRFNQGVFA